MINPVLKYRRKKGYTRYKLAELIKSNSEKVKRVEECTCKDISAIEVIKGMANHLKDVKEKDMVLAYLTYKKSVDSQTE